MNFASIPESLVESELFGYVEGAFTGARKGGKIGLFERNKNINWSKQALDFLTDYHWPGNIRELINLISYVLQKEQAKGTV